MASGRNVADGMNTKVTAVDSAQRRRRRRVRQRRLEWKRVGEWEGVVTDK